MLWYLLWHQIQLKHTKKPVNWLLKITLLKFAHLSLQSVIFQIWWRPRQLRLPEWHHVMHAADDAGWHCLCLLLPEKRVAIRQEINNMTYWYFPYFITLFKKANKQLRPSIQAIKLLLTFEAATSCAVLAAISCEHTINSSNFPLPCTTISAASLKLHSVK